MRLRAWSIVMKYIKNKTHYQICGENCRRISNNGMVFFSLIFHFYMNIQLLRYTFCSNRFLKSIDSDVVYILVYAWFWDIFVEQLTLGCLQNDTNALYVEHQMFVWKNLEFITLCVTWNISKLLADKWNLCLYVNELDDIWGRMGLIRELLLDLQYLIRMITGNLVQLKNKLWYNKCY